MRLLKKSRVAAAVARIPSDRKEKKGMKKSRE
jgi:hypothetical protein